MSKINVNKFLDLKEQLENTSFLQKCLSIEEMLDIIDQNNFKNINEFKNIIEESINEYEIIYYSDAIKFLAEHDQSLLKSLTLAADLSYKTNELNSELLATLLIQDLMKEELNELNVEEIES